MSDDSSYETYGSSEQSHVTSRQDGGNYYKNLPDLPSGPVGGRTVGVAGSAVALLLLVVGPLAVGVVASVHFHKSGCLELSRPVLAGTVIVGFLAVVACAGLCMHLCGVNVRTEERPTALMLRFCAILGFIALFVLAAVSLALAIDKQPLCADTLVDSALGMALYYLVSIPAVVCLCYCYFCQCYTPDPEYTEPCMKLDRFSVRAPSDGKGIVVNLEGWKHPALSVTSATVDIQGDALFFQVGNRYGSTAVYAGRSLFLPVPLIPDYIPEEEIWTGESRVDVTMRLLTEDDKRGSFSSKTIHQFFQDFREESVTIVFRFKGIANGCRVSGVLAEVTQKLAWFEQRFYQDVESSSV